MSSITTGRNLRRGLATLFCVSCLSILCVPASVAQPPAHAQNQLAPGYRESTRMEVFQRGGSSIPVFDIGVLAFPEYRESRFSTGWGVGAGAQWFLTPPLSVRLGLDYEAIRAAREFSDADLISMGAALQFDLMRTTDHALTSSFAMNYIAVDYEEGDASFKDGIGALVGLEYIFGLDSGFGFGLGAGYRFNLEKPKTSSNEKISLEAFQIRIKMMMSF